MVPVFENKVVAYCAEHNLLPTEHNAVVLVALSGGGDSVALLHVLDEMRGNFGIVVEAAHLNHSLRGHDSDEDELFCRNLCNNRGIHLTVERLPKGKIAESGESLETSARNERLAFLIRVAKDRKAARIATGHTQDDLVETVLHRLIRGTGPSGLVGILPIRDNLWIRPLLGITRNEIRDYLREKSLEYRDDASNLDTGFIRNRIRNEVIPLLRERFSPNITGVISRFAELSRIQEEYFQKIIEEAFAEVVLFSNPYKILLDKARFMKYHKVIKQRVVRYCLEMIEGKGRDTDSGEIETILEEVDKQRGTMDVTSSIRCGVGKEHVAFMRRTYPYEPIRLTIPGETIIPMGGGRIIAGKAAPGCIVNGVMNVALGKGIEEKYGPLTVGSVRHGETILPAGKTTSVKIRGLIAKTRLPEILRDTVSVVRAGAVPLWIPGLQTSAYLKKSLEECGSFAQSNYVVLTYEDGLIMK